MPPPAGKARSRGLHVVPTPTLRPVHRLVGLAHEGVRLHLSRAARRVDGDGLLFQVDLGPLLADS